MSTETSAICLLIVDDVSVTDGDLVKALGEWGEESRPQGGNSTPLRVATGSGTTVSEATDPSSSYTTVTPQMLVTYKQYAPHGQPTLFTNPDSSSTADNGGLLSAQDKINELGRLVEQQKGEMERMAKEMEDVQAEKVSMEYLLREKLERLVQNEIEERLSAYRKEGEDQQGLLLQQRLRTLKQELEKKTNEVTAISTREQRLQVEMSQLRQAAAAQESTIQDLRSRGTTAGTASPEIMGLKKQCSMLLKERQAVQTIMEDKIRVLLNNISSSSSVVLRETPEAGGSAGQSLRNNLVALNRLVNAFITALHNSEEGGVHGGNGSSKFGDGGGTTIPSTGTAWQAPAVADVRMPAPPGRETSGNGPNSSRKTSSGGRSSRAPGSGTPYDAALVVSHKGIPA